MWLSAVCFPAETAGSLRRSGRDSACRARFGLGRSSPLSQRRLGRSMGIDEVSVAPGDAVVIADPARPKPRSQLHRTFDDLKRGLAQHELWGTLGARDVLQRYRRS